MGIRTENGTKLYQKRRTSGQVEHCEESFLAVSHEARSFTRRDEAVSNPQMDGGIHVPQPDG